MIGIHDDYRRQSPKAFVEIKTNSSAITLEQMKDFLKDRLGKHETINALEIRDALPRTAVSCPRRSFTMRTGFLRNEF